MAFDFKKEYKEFYLPKNKPGIVMVPSMNYIAVRGSGDPNQEDGEYKQSIGLLYGIAFTIKMSKKGDHRIEGYFDYVVPPLEGFWWQDGVDGIDYAHKEDPVDNALDIVEFLGCESPALGPFLEEPGKIPWSKFPERYLGDAGTFQILAPFLLMDLQCLSCGRCMVSFP